MSIPPPMDIKVKDIKVKDIKVKESKVKDIKVKTCFFLERKKQRTFEKSAAPIFMQEKYTLSNV